MSDLSHEIRRARSQWRYRGDERPDFAALVLKGQESVWDYPRPPRLVKDSRRVRVCCGYEVIAETRRSVRVLETASPPVFYISSSDVRLHLLKPVSGSSMCEWKGRAVYWSVHCGDILIENAAWGYPDPLPGYEAIADHLSFYPGKVDCYVDGLRVEPQPGSFYGGWVTPEIVGPFKGEPGTGWW
jgi:uncharacterized protein (DUF427 family)